ncbi:MAG: hypothetical protein ACTTIC_01210 [Helicobacteraceae bacterium]
MDKTAVLNELGAIKAEFAKQEKALLDMESLEKSAEKVIDGDLRAIIDASVLNQDLVDLSKTIQGLLNV